MISIVVPVYNVAEYLEKCVDSITNQTFKDLEIILVDDGSTDISGKMCDDLALTDSRIKVIHKVNGGLMSAWKEGVRHACGDYIGFVDSDDYIDADMYERLYNSAIENDTDITLCKLIREFDDYSDEETLFTKSGFYDRERIEKEIYPRMISFGQMLNRALSPNRVTKLFKREILLNNLELCDDKVSVGEDLVATFACMCDAKRIFLIDDFAPYHYKIRGNSIMAKYNPNFFKQGLYLKNALKNIADTKKVFDFTVQLNNDFLSIAYFGIERNISSNKASYSQMLEYIKETVLSDEYKDACKAESLSKNNKKCFVYKTLIQLRLYGLLYLFIKNVVVPVREKRR